MSNKKATMCSTFFLTTESLHGRRWAGCITAGGYLAFGDIEGRYFVRGQAHETVRTAASHETSCRQAMKWVLQSNAMVRGSGPHCNTCRSSPYLPEGKVGFASVPSAAVLGAREVGREPDR